MSDQKTVFISIPLKYTTGHIFFWLGFDTFCIWLGFESFYIWLGCDTFSLTLFRRRQKQEDATENIVNIKITLRHQELVYLKTKRVDHFSNEHFASFIP